VDIPVSHLLNPKEKRRLSQLCLPFKQWVFAANNALRRADGSGERVENSGRKFYTQGASEDSVEETFAKGGTYGQTHR